MAFESTIGGDGSLFVGEDKILDLTVVDAAGVPVDIGAWAIRHVVRTKDAAADPPIFNKLATVIGVYNVSPGVNTQKARVTYTDTEMNTVKAKTYRHSWKRMDDGSETVLAWGDFIPQIATANVTP